MTANNTRSQLNQKLDQLPPGILQTVVDFVDFLLHRQNSSSQFDKEQEFIVTNCDSDIRNGKDSNVRPPISGSILDITETWEGDDFEDCLQMVYDTRSQIKA